MGCFARLSVIVSYGSFSGVLRNEYSHFSTKSKIIMVRVYYTHLLPSQYLSNCVEHVLKFIACTAMHGV